MTKRPGPPPGFDRPPTSADAIEPPLPERIGPYAIERRLGVGGMATVYLAKQAQPKRLVALKVMRPGIAAAGLDRRFRREMEIMAKLRHPHIAQIFDAGMHDDGSGGMPYFVMEYIPDALELIAYADQRGLDAKSRVKLFVKVCAGVQHGHLQKIIHRDLKPGNILVDTRGEPKIIDYGVARATEVDLAGPTQQTEAGKLVGTVAYMSPEQVEARPGEIDASSDVYALGVILFRLLTGRSPYALQGMPLHEACRVIREDAPVRPSSIKPELRGDLETIVMTALEKEKRRRYVDAGAFGRDLLRWLGAKPIKARRAGAVYRLSLFMRRNRTSVIAASIVGLSVAALGAGGVWLWRKNRDVVNQQTQIDQARDEEAQRARETVATSGAAASGTTNALRKRVVITAHGGGVRAVAFSGDSSFAATIGADDAVALWSMPNGLRRLVVERLDGLSGTLLVLPQGDRVLLGRRDGIVESLDTSSGEVVESPLAHGGEIVALALSPMIASGPRLPGGFVVASAGTDLLVRLWPIDGEATQVVRALEGPVRSLAFTGMARTLVAGLDSGELLMSTPRLARARRIPMGRAAVTHVVASVGGTVVAGNAAGQLRGHRHDPEIEPGDGPLPPRPPRPAGVREEIRNAAEAFWGISAHAGPMTALAAHPSAELIVTTDGAGHVRFWEAESGKALGGFEHQRRLEDGRMLPIAVHCACFTPDGDWLAIGDDIGLLTLVPIVRGTGLPEEGVDVAP